MEATTSTRLRPSEIALLVLAVLIAAATIAAAFFFAPKLERGPETLAEVVSLGFATATPATEALAADTVDATEDDPADAAAATSVVPEIIVTPLTGRPDHLQARPATEETSPPTTTTAAPPPTTTTPPPTTTTEPPPTTTTTPPTVPDVVGMRDHEARDELADAGLSSSVTDYCAVPGNACAAVVIECADEDGGWGGPTWHRIIEQTPAAGTPIDETSGHVDLISTIHCPFGHAGGSVAVGG